ncbi:hypothetical protein ACFXC8_00175 [Streptomyces sp. NPDC059441]|uniref:hypothetical protein n=1 Tax=Streptomyces sp. NPDC059441 TaxID=3346829 RepID=UPI0036A0D1F5
MYDTHTPAEWLAFLSLGLSLTSAAAAPYLLLVDADRWAWPLPLTAAVDHAKPVVWDATRSEVAYPLLREWANARHIVRQTGRTSREACRDAAALVLLLTTSPKGATRA